jgi:predicted nucleic acid-binding protein
MVSVTDPATAVIDAGLVIALLDADDAHHEWAARVLRTLGPGRLKISVLTLAEAIVHPVMAGQGERALAAVRRLEVDVTTLTDADVLPLAELRAASKLRMPDAVVLHAAMRASTAIATTDRRLACAAVAAGLPIYAPFRVTTPPE